MISGNIRCLLGSSYNSYNLRLLATSANSPNVNSSGINREIKPLGLTLLLDDVTVSTCPPGELEGVADVTAKLVRLDEERAGLEKTELEVVEGKGEGEGTGSHCEVTLYDCEQWKPVSIRQLLLQPSPGITLPSSHSSSEFLLPSPHTVSKQLERELCLARHS